MTKHILIIGGMGPQASVNAHQQLLKRFEEKNAQLNNVDYPRITHISVNVKDFISESKYKDEAEKYLLECLSDINTNNIDYGFIACNTAHLLFDSLQEKMQGKLVSMIDTVLETIQDQTIGIVASPSTIKQNLYGSKVSIHPSRTSLDTIEQIIRKVISGVPIQHLVKDLQAEIDALLDAGAEKVVLGCSELSMFSDYLDPETIVDPVDVTILKILNK